MSNTSAGLSLQATLGLKPSTFVRMDPNNGFAVLAATGTTQPIIGVAEKYTELQGGLASALGASEPNIAAGAGSGLIVYFTSDVCKVKVGSGGCIPGSILTADSSANAVIAASGQFYGATSLNFGLQGDLVDVLVLFGKLP